ncbi:MAG: UvrD-helicase domain-containing protein [Bacteroidales bacterium]|nr:UvrD-helicase domain-containing protein [Bacteroidales bacterium]
MSFTVYRSSAGSGKTYTLVKEYLKIVLSRQTGFRNILAITFTNKAANEMRDRILTSLKEMSGPEEFRESGSVKYMLPELMKLTGMDEQSLSQNAAGVLTNILHNYQDFAVSTIDSFVHRIIRTFAFDLHLPLNFEVELDEQNMVNMAVDILLGRVGIDENTTTILKRYTESRIDDEQNWDIENDLKKFSKRLLKDDIAEYLPALKSMKSKDLIAVHNKLAFTVRSFQQELSAKAASLMKLWNDNGITESDLFHGKSGIFGWVRRLDEQDFSKMEPNKYVIQTLEEDKWYSGKTDPARKVVIDSLKPQMLDLFQSITGYIDKHKSKFIFYRLLKRNIFPLAVLNEIDEVIGQIRSAEGIIHISEFDKRIARMVHDEPVPFIYERLGEKYQHFLIDEFQDTSVLEWQNILPLLENSLAVDQFNMIVGDAKQAIYRFKGGEVEQLVNLPEIYKKPDTPEMDSREQQLIRTYQPEILKYNFRSREEIINFNNDLYSYVSGLLPPLLQEIYAGGVQELPGPRPGGEVCLNFFDAKGKKEEWELDYYNKILEILDELVGQNVYSYRDIAILCRSNDDASKLARHLLLRGINVISAESLLLSSSPEVNFLVFCLDYIANDNDMLALAAMISYLNIEENDDGLHEHLLICRPDKGAGNNDIAWKGFQTFLKSKNIVFKPAELRQMGLYERVEALVRIFITSPVPDPYIIFFLDAVFEYSRNKRLAPEDFTTYWRDNNRKYSIVVPEGQDAVNIMTIHKAKGLEFPVVIYPFANSRLNIAREQKWEHINDPDLPGLKTALLPLSSDLKETDHKALYEMEKDKALLDMLNILYVATTRPTERLFLLCNKPPAKKNATAGDLTSIPELLKAWLIHKELWNPDKDEYRLGDPGHVPFKRKEKEKPRHQQQYISSDWRRKILLSGHAAEYWDLDDDARNLEWGKLVHAILARVVNASEIDQVISEEINQGRISGEESIVLSGILKKIVESREVMPFFDGSWQVKNEAAIMRSGGSEYRPDRIMFKENKAIVLDYKTGVRSAAHIQQLNRYGELLKEMGYDPVEKYLLYIDREFELLPV